MKNIERKNKMNISLQIKGWNWNFEFSSCSMSFFLSTEVVCFRWPQTFHPPPLHSLVQTCIILPPCFFLAPVFTFFPLCSAHRSVFPCVPLLVIAFKFCWHSFFSFLWLLSLFFPTCYTLQSLSAALSPFLPLQKQYIWFWIAFGAVVCSCGHEQVTSLKLIL